MNVMEKYEGMTYTQICEAEEKAKLREQAKLFKKLLSEDTEDTESDKENG
jgi:hypothetical protein